jgi:hypothetical protein
VGAGDAGYAIDFNRLGSGKLTCCGRILEGSGENSTTELAVGADGQQLESILKGETFAGILSSPFEAKAMDAGWRRVGDSREVLPPRCRVIDSPFLHSSIDMETNSGEIESSR